MYIKQYRALHALHADAR